MSETKQPKASRKELEGRKDVLRSLLLEQWQAFAMPLDQYRWPVERARWYELAFCLLFRLGQPQIEADGARRVVNMLVDLRLLDLQPLADLCDEDGEPDLKHADADLMLRLLKRSGFTPAQASVAVASLCQTAFALRRRHGGKVQRYLRHYGQRMLDDLDNQFSFSHIGADDARHIFTHWLQNVLNMPLGLAEPEMKQLCQQFEISLDELVEIADELDLNLALLDDMVASSIGTFVGPEAAEE
jgi:hypothetical protein